MTFVTTAPEETGTRELLASFQGSIRELRSAVESLKQQADDGEEGEVSALTKALSPAEALIRTCRKLEMTLAEEKYRDLGIAQGGYAHDLDAARAEIGERLDRLRDAGGSAAVSD